MSKYEIRGFYLYDAYRRKIATAREQAIYDVDDKLVATIRENDIFDSNDQLMATIDGTDIFDVQGTKVGAVTDALKSISGVKESVLHLALWYCFVR